ncbi:MAG TPA: EF-hand domain-containing protein [Candidatus Thalassarchaeaceae archaeon]|nr:MAG TPA: EF-hand domain-containing protein [Candidatus Poseidoniales archaeon]HII49633.1 EF-hand domain-containing protein [Candidatus Thalassarchaeaceae archaeon]
MTSQWDQQVDALAESIYKMVESGNGDAGELRATAHQTIDKVAGILPDVARAALHERLDSKLDELIGLAATVASDSVQDIGGAESVERMIQTLRGMNPEMLDKMFTFIDKNDDSVINFQEFQSFVSSAAPTGMVVTSEQAAAAFRTLDVDGDGFLTKAAILGIEQTMGNHEQEKMGLTEEEQQRRAAQEEQQRRAAQEEQQRRAAEEEVASVEEPEPIEDTGTPISATELIARMGEARFMSEKKRITQELEGRSTEFSATIDRIRNRKDRNGMMEVEIIAEEEHFILSIPAEGMSLPESLESGKGEIHIRGKVNGFHMARNAIIILAHDVE